MKNKNILLASAFALSVVVASVSTLFAQIPLPRCRANADQIYYVESGQQVAEVHPAGNGYQLNILGTGANKFTVIKEPYMTSVSLIPNYTNATAAKWQISFAPRMGQQLRSVRMMSECTGRAVSEYPLTVTVTLLDQ